MPSSSGPVPDVARLLLSALLVLQFASSLTTALSCLPCYEVACGEVGPCAGSTVPTPCGCCQVCARQRSERCGGPFGLAGTCDRGLRCVTTRPPASIFGGVGVCE